ncbi:hypothetical protein ABT299_25925 [Spirillospora sp. NPDC000708]
MTLSQRNARRWCDIRGYGNRSRWRRLSEPEPHGSMPRTGLITSQLLDLAAATPPERDLRPVSRHHCRRQRGL